MALHLHVCFVLVRKQNGERDEVATPSQAEQKPKAAGALLVQQSQGKKVAKLKS